MVRCKYKRIYEKSIWKEIQPLTFFVLSSDSLQPATWIQMVESPVMLVPLDTQVADVKGKPSSYLCYIKDLAI